MIILSDGEMLAVATQGYTIEVFKLMEKDGVEELEIHGTCKVKRRNFEHIKSTK